MLRRAVALSCLLAFGAITSPPAVAQEEAPIKIAVLDIDAVVAQSSSGKALKAKLEEFVEGNRAEIETQQGKIKDLRTQMTDAVNAGDQAQLPILEKQFEEARRNLRLFQEEKQRDAQQMQQEGLGEIQKQLDPVLKAIQDEAGYDLVLNKQRGVVLLVGERLDITAQVLERLK